MERKSPHGGGWVGGWVKQVVDLAPGVWSSRAKQKADVNCC